jgi:glycosyltransferase involved in cell wall biosynthesis
VIDPQTVAVFTEHRNATHHINFVAPFEGGAAGPGVGFTLSGDEIAALGAADLHARLEHACTSRRIGLAVLSRLVGEGADSVRTYFQRRGVPVCFHIDDWLFGLPPDLGPPYVARYDHAFGVRLQAALQAADAVLCATPHLAALVRARVPGKPVLTLPGICYRPFPGRRPALRARLARARRRLVQRRRVVVGYAGSSSHLRDLALVLPALHQLMERHPAVHFQTLGMPAPACLAARWPGRVSALGYSRDYAGYLRTLYELGWDIGLCPLVDDEFNRSKTATKLAEYTACGVPALCSDVVPYRDVLATAPGARLVPAAGWPQALQDWCSDETARRAGWRAAEQALLARGAAQPAAALMAALGRVARGAPALPSSA